MDLITTSGPVVWFPIVFEVVIGGTPGDSLRRNLLTLKQVIFAKRCVLTLSRCLAEFRNMDKVLRALSDPDPVGATTFRIDA